MEGFEKLLGQVVLRLISSNPGLNNNIIPSREIKHTNIISLENSSKKAAEDNLFSLSP